MVSILMWFTWQLFIYAPTQSFKLRSFTYPTRTSLKKQYCLIASFWKKDYLQINAFLGSDIRIEKNIKALQMKTIASLGGGAIGETLISINESLDGSHHAEQ